MRAEIERLKTMKSIIESQVKELNLARAEALQLRQEIQLQNDCMKEGVKKNPVRKTCCSCCCFFSFKINSSDKKLLTLRSPLFFFFCFKINQVLRTETARAANFSRQTICYSLFSGSPFTRKTFQSTLSSFY